MQNKLKQILLFIFLSGIWNIAFSQEKEILKILNRELKKEVKNQFKSSNFNGDTIRIVEGFSIDTHKNLSFQIKKTSPYFTGYQTIKQKVSLAKILKVGKDIQIILETEKDAVTTEYLSSDGDLREETIKGSLFFLYLSNEKQNDDLGIELQEAFQKAGFQVSKDYWYD
ncbi:hypothetical protein GCM10023210_38250 [Chryseobacterium ginsengisoli]|uniref:DUF4252 domain-containing protein n=1 Tax=Chryseobacterium ginsengisoli TaxID=363853 RepID=A0ABP9MR75_9FLAO